MADISQFVQQIQIAARGEEVRDALVDSLNGMNDSIPASVEDALTAARNSGAFKGETGPKGEKGDTGQPGPKGENGAQGPRGNDGYSPGVTVTTIAGGHRVTITDRDHPSGQTFDVLDGAGNGDMTGATYDPDNTVATAGGIAAYVAENAQEALSFDNAPARNSTNPVTSHGIYTVIQNLLSQIHALEDRVEALEAGTTGSSSGNAGSSSGNSGSSSGNSGGTVDEDNLLVLECAEVEENYLVFDGTGAEESDGFIELDAGPSASGASVSENYLSIAGATVTENTLESGGSTVSENILNI